MNQQQQQRSARFSRGSKSWRPQWKECASASLFCNFNVSSLLPTVDLDSFNEAHFGHHPKQTLQGNLAFSKPRENLVKHLSADLVEQSRPSQSRVQVPETKNASVVVRKGGARRLSLRPQQVSVSNVCKSSASRTTIGDMIKTGRVDHMHGAKPTLDIPEASTSGTVRGEFWNERRKGCFSSDYRLIGTLYSSRGEDDRKYWGLPQGKTLEENVSIDQNHSVSTGFQQGMQVDEKSIWLSSSHKFGGNHVLATQYADDLKGGNNFNVNTTHNFIRDSTLSTNLCTNSSGDCSFEVELQREKKRGNQEVLESIMTNFRTGERLLKLQARNVLKDIVFLNSMISDLRGQNALRFMATMPLWRSGFLSSSLATDLHGAQKICINAMQKIHEQIMVGAYFNTDLKQEDSISLEGKHQLNGRGNLALKLTKYHQGPPKWDVTTSLTTKQNSWMCTYRNFPTEGRSLGCEWRREISQDQFFSIQAAARNWAWTILAEMLLRC
ncbi:unnamed protein product [Calypogeia fissa]